jgi:hypothetical protein
MSWLLSGYVRFKISMVGQTCCDTPMATPIWRSEWLNRHVATLQWRRPFEDQNGWTDMLRHSSGYILSKIRMVEQTHCDTPVATSFRISEWLNKHIATLQWLHPFEDQNGWTGMMRHSIGYILSKIRMVEQTYCDTPVATSFRISEWLNRHVATLQWLQPFEDQNGWTGMMRHSIGCTNLKIRMVKQTCCDTPVATRYPFLCLKANMGSSCTTWHDMEVHGELKSVTTLPLRGKGPQYHWSRGSVGPQICVGSYRREKDLLSLCEIEPWIVDPDS